MSAARAQQRANPALAFRPEPGAIPTSPGCYLWRDDRDRVVYVGKAKDLRARLNSYFGAWEHIAQRTRSMLEAAASVEWIVVDNEVEALHLEYNLIQRYRPRHNVKYTDDKSYPYLAVTVQDDVPRVMSRRNPRQDGTRHFGPYAHAGAMRDTLDLLLKVYPVRSCSKGVYDRHHRQGRPCLLAHIGRCAAPCVGRVGVEEHRDLVEDLMAFLAGDTRDTLEGFEARMRSAAAELNFEAAARLRDQLDAVRKVLEKQQAVTGRDEDFDAVHYAMDEVTANFQAFFVRGGRVVGRRGWAVDRVEDLDEAGLLARFLVDFAVERGADLPREVLVPVMPEDAATLQDLLTADRARARAERAKLAAATAGAGRNGAGGGAGDGGDGPGADGGERAGTGRVRLRVPRRGDKRAFLEQVRDNAREALAQQRTRRANDFNARSRALEQLQEALGLARAPLRIECYDISTLQGTSTVASMVVMEDGLARKGEYRRFSMRTLTGQDDFAAMHEVITRRFRRQREDAAKPVDARRFAVMPDLVVVDGGKGQLAAAKRAMDEQGVTGVDLISLAKRLEEVYLPGRSDPVMLPRGGEALFLLQRVRDEAHRFAITFHRSKRGRAMTESALDVIPGVGPARRRAIVEHLGSVAEARRASVEQLAAVPGLSGTLARVVHDHLRGLSTPPGDAGDAGGAGGAGDAGGPGVDEDADAPVMEAV